MMNFMKITDSVHEAINSLKPVTIAKNWKGHWMVFMPQGGLMNDFTSAGPFVDFDSARKYAESNVGFTWKELADAGLSENSC